MPIPEPIPVSGDMRHSNRLKLNVDYQTNKELVTGEIGLPREKSGHPGALCGISFS